MTGKHKAIFLDRDGTLIRNHHYGCDPSKLELLDGVAEGLQRLHAASFQLVVVTNQSGIARGYFTQRELRVVHARLAEMLADQGAKILDFYFCPHHKDGSVAEYARSCDCRKPRPGMVLRAAREHDIDLAASWFLGDILDDVEAGNAAGCRSVLIDVGTEGKPENARRTPLYVARDFRDASAFILRTQHVLRERARS